MEVYQMPWKINAYDVIHIGRTPGGDRFTEFVDALIRSQAAVCGLLMSEIRTNLRTNIKDGGVDTEVCQCIPSDLTGWLKDAPTIWQYKATEAKNISESTLEEEVCKEYAKNRLKEGYAYRLCICDAITPEKKKKWEEFLDQCIRKINPDAPEAKILTADDLAWWANQFPPIVVRYFRPLLSGYCFHLETWKNNITSLTPTYVPVPAWDDISKRIKQHVDFAAQVPDAVLSISGEAGVGKTRLVYECLAHFENAKNLVVYTYDDKSALELARLLANDPNIFAILVADECGVEARMRLNELLRGSRNRVRVIAIDNSGERPPGYAPENWLEKIPLEIMEKILGENYPEVPAERRRAYAALAEGYVRLAADLCRHDGLIARSGNVEPVLPHIRDYLRMRLTDRELEVLQALSLVTKVGVKDDVVYQLNDLSNLVGISPQELKQVAKKLHDGPGFVSIAGRFFYVTPEIVAQVGFDLAWKQWAEDPQEFLQRIPQSLLEYFLKRVARSASDPVRQVVADFFRKWANRVTTRELASIETVDRFVTLVEIDPQTYLPTLRRIIKEGTQEELSAIRGDNIGGRWGPRRPLVWLVERIAAFPEHFEDAEKIILKLALAESEPHIGNNATATWKQLFRIYLSGTAVPFLERLKKLEERIFADNSNISSLAMDALDELLTPFSSRVLGPPVVAGRIPPEEWRPKTDSELKECMNAVINLLQKIANSDSTMLHKRALEIAIKNARLLLRLGYLSSLKALLHDNVLDDKMRVDLIGKVEEFLHFECKPKPGKHCLPQDYVDEVRQWVKALKQSDFHGRIVSLVDVDPWHHSILGDEEEWRSELYSLAMECLKNPERFSREIEWICSADAKSSALLGEEIGKLDKDATFLDLVFESAFRFRSPNFARGYIRGLLTAFPNHADRINEWIDKIQIESPELAFELALAGGDSTKALQRALQLVDDKKLPAVYLHEFLYGIGHRPLSLEEIEQVLVRLVKPSESGDNAVVRVCIKFIAFILKNEEEKREGVPILQHPRIQSLVWQLMEATARNGGGESFWWAQILKTLAIYDPDRAIRFAATGLLSDSLDHKEECEKFLIDFASKYPEMVMNRVGEIALSNEGWRFFIYTYRELIQSLPVNTVIDWLQKYGVEAARRVAGHLPVPYIDSDGKAVVPPLTEFVLKTFEEDEQVFRKFCAGVHSFQIYAGDIAAQYKKEAEIARKFLNHPLRRVREWAQIEIDNLILNLTHSTEFTIRRISESGTTTLPPTLVDRTLPSAISRRNVLSATPSFPAASRTGRSLSSPVEVEE